MGDKETMAEAPPPAAADDIGEETQCTDHPYRNNPGGICAFCLQEKLGKLVSSSSSSSSPPFPSLPPQPSSPPFPSSSIAPVQPKADQNIGGGSSSSNASSSNNVSVLNRSKPVAPAAADSPRKKSFWSFLYLNSSSSSNKRRSTSSVAGDNSSDRSDLKLNEEKSNAKTLEPEAGSPASGSHVSSPSSSSRKVARSRSVGCGSRSFSGDFLERISTGFGDCTLRRVESHRESNSEAAVHHRQQLDRYSERRIKERVRCGGIFGGFGVISSSSSTHWLSAAAAAAGDHGDDFYTRRSNTARASTSMVRDSRSRNRSWAWAFASPMRALKPATTSKPYGPRNNAAVSRVNGAGNGSGKIINGKVGGGNPSLLAVGGG